MTRKILILAIVAAFVVGSITTTTMASAQGNAQGDNLIVDALNSIAAAISGIEPNVNVDPTPITNTINVDPTPITVNAPQGPQGEQGPQGIPGLPGAEGSMGPQGESFTQIKTAGYSTKSEFTDRVVCISDADFLVYVTLFLEPNAAYFYNGATFSDLADPTPNSRVDSFVFGGNPGDIIVIDKVSLIVPPHVVGELTLHTTDSAVASCTAS